MTIVVILTIVAVPAFNQGQECLQRGWFWRQSGLAAVLLDLRHQLLEDVSHVRADFRQGVLNPLADSPIAACRNWLR